MRTKEEKKGRPRYAGITVLGEMPNRVHGYQLGIVEGDESRRTLCIKHRLCHYGAILDHIRQGDYLAVLVEAEGAFFAHDLNMAQQRMQLHVHMAQITSSAFERFQTQIPLIIGQDTPHHLARLLAEDVRYNSREQSIFNWLKEPARHG